MKSSLCLRVLNNFASGVIRKIPTILESIQSENLEKVKRMLEQKRLISVKGITPIRIRTKASKLKGFSVSTIMIGMSI